MNTEDFSLYGAILFIEESLTYKGESFEELEAAFRQAVAGHIKSCKEKGEEPPFNE